MPREDHEALPTTTGRTVLVFGATGKQGGAVGAALKADGWSVRAFVRDAGGAAAKALTDAGLDVRAGSFSDEASIRAAMTGVHGVYSVQPSSGSAGSGITDAEEVRAGKAVAEIAKEAGVRHLVYASAGTASKGPTGMAHLDTKVTIEAHVKALEVPSTIVRPATFMDLLTLPGLGLDKGRFSFFLKPHQAAHFIAVEDIGKIVATIFRHPERFVGRTLEIAGDELTGRDIEAALSEAVGTPIAYDRFSDEVLRNDPFLDRTTAMFDEGLLTRNADIPALKREFGDLLSFRQWLGGAGRPSLKAALTAQGQGVALR